MAHIITAEGKIVEGAILTEEDVAIIGEIVEKINTVAYDLYYNSRIGWARTRFAGDLLNTYHITRRTPAVVPLEFPEVANV